MDGAQDDSYTPRAVCVLAGSTEHSLVRVVPRTVLYAGPRPPVGWVSLPLGRPAGAGIATFLLRIVVLENHSGGRDTRVRGLRLLGPRPGTAPSTGAAGGTACDPVLQTLLAHQQMR